MAYPTTASEMATTIGFGTTWNYGFLCEDADGTELQAAFGGSLFAFASASTPMYEVEGTATGDKALWFGNGLDDIAFALEDTGTLDADATEDLVLALVVRLQDAQDASDHMILAMGESADNYWRIYQNGNNLHFTVGDSVDTVTRTVPIDPALMKNTWVTILASLDRSSNTMGLSVAYKTLVGTTSATTHNSTTGVSSIGALTNIAAVHLGGHADGLTAGMRVSAVYMGCGVGAAGTLDLSIATGAINLFNAVMGSASSSAPVITVTSSPPQNDDPIVIEMSDDAGLSKYILTCQDREDGPRYVVYDPDAGFIHPFGGRSTRTGGGTTGNPYIFTVYKRGRWPTGIQPSFRAFAVDTHGQLTSETEVIDVEEA